MDQRRSEAMRRSTGGNTGEQLDPEPPRPPGTPEIDLDVPVDPGDRERPETEDVEPEAGGVEPPD